MPRPESESSPDAALWVRGLRKSYGSRLAADGIDLTAEAGQVTAILGPNGAGKTTTIECCVGLRRPDSGELRVLGHDRSDPASAAALRASVGVMLQDGGLPMAAKAGAVLTHVARMYDSPRPTGELLERLDLAGSAGTPVRRLSGGQRQRLAFACAVVGRPRLVFLDEPSAGLDPRSRRESWSLVRELREEGVGVVLTTHLMDEAEALADTVVVFDSGTVVATGAPDRLAGYAVVDVTPAGPVPTEAWRDAVAERLRGAGRPDLAGATSARAPRAGGPGGCRVEVASGPGGAVAADVAVVAEAARGADPGAAVVAGRRTLEDVFLELTGRTLSAADEAAGRGRRTA